MNGDDAAEVPDVARGSSGGSSDRVRRSPSSLIGFALLAVTLIGVGLYLWVPWGSLTACSADEGRAVDAGARLCYDIPEGWRPAEEDELLNTTGVNGIPPFTSGLVPDDEYTGRVLVFTIDPRTGESASEEGIEPLARWLASGGTLGEGCAEVESTAATVDGHRAATATMIRPDCAPVSDVAGPTRWVRVTVVELDDAISVLYTSTAASEDDLYAADGRVRVLDGVHDTLAVD